MYKKSRPFKCDLCKAAFNKDEDRRAHLLFTHQFLAPQCQSYDMIQNRIQAEDNLTTDYRNQIKHIESTLKKNLDKFNMVLPIEEFIWLVSLTKKLKEFNLSQYNLSHLKVPMTYAETLYQNINGKPVPSNYRKPEYADKFDKFMEDNQHDIFVNDRCIYSVTCIHYPTYIGIERHYRVDELKKWNWYGYYDY